MEFFYCDLLLKSLSGFNHLLLKNNRSRSLVRLFLIVEQNIDVARCVSQFPEKERHLPRLAAGEAIGSLALTEAAGQNATEGVGALYRNGKLSGTKCPVLDGGVADFAIVAANSDAGLSLVLVDLAAEGVTLIRDQQPTRAASPRWF